MEKIMLGDSGLHWENQYIRDKDGAPILDCDLDAALKLSKYIASQSALAPKPLASDDAKDAEIARLKSALDAGEDSLGYALQFVPECADALAVIAKLKESE